MNKVNYFIFKSSAAAAGIALVYGALEAGKMVAKKLNEKSEGEKAKTK